LAATKGASPVLPKSDEIRKGSKFSLTPDDKHPQVNSLAKPTTDNVNEEFQNRKEPISKSPQEFTQSIRERTKSKNPCDAENKTKSENPSEAEDNTKPKEQDAASGTIKLPSELQNLIKGWLAEHSEAVEQSNEGTATKIEPKAGWQLAQIIANTQTGKSPPVTGHAVKSAEIKLLHSTEKGQLGLKTVLPTTSEGQNGLKAVLPGTSVLPDTSKSTPESKITFETGKNTDKVSVSAKTIAETKSITEKGIIKELTPEVPANTGKSTTTASGKIPSANINPSVVHTKAPEIQLQPAGIDPEKSVPAKETEAKITDAQTLSKLLNSNGKEATHTGNNLSENQNAQKLNIASVQVSTGQTKDQGTSTSNKNNSQGFEQMLSHNTPQTLITEQTPATAKNATAANMPGQNSSSNVSADIGKQILESIQSSVSQQGAERQITVRLNPPELGKVSITFRQQDGELTGLMEVSKAQTRFEIEQTLPQIIRNLADSGIHIKRLEVMLSNQEQPGQGTLGNQSMQSGGAHQHNSANPGTQGNNHDANESNEWLASNNGYENLYELQEALITDSSINMLI
jgi:flagellar hook-length control protein FliK